MMLTSKPEKDLSLMTILPMIQSIVLNCWDRENFPYTKSQVILFSVLLNRDSATMKEIAVFLSCSKEQATRVVAPLVDDGLAERYVDPGNRNFIHIRLTNAGREYVLNQRGKLHHNLEQLLDTSLSEDERQLLFDSLHTAIGLLKKVR